MSTSMFTLLNFNIRYKDRHSTKNKQRSSLHKKQTAINSIYCVQSSIFKLAICPKSEVLRVNTVALLTIAIAAIFKSIVPRRGYNFLIR